MITILCTHCNGTGLEPNTTSSVCSECLGKFKMDVEKIPEGYRQKIVEGYKQRVDETIIKLVT